MLLGLLVGLSAAATTDEVTVSHGGHPLAAKEVRRALRHRLGAWPAVVDHLTTGQPATVLLGTHAELTALEPAVSKAATDVAARLLHDESHAVRTVRLSGGRKVVVCIGGSAAGVGYAASSLVEGLGGRSYGFGDVAARRRGEGEPALPDVAAGPFNARFSTRGVLPYHDFPMGPDWWTADQFKAFASQLSKMRMNVWGFHSYAFEPAAWIGKSEGWDRSTGAVTRVYSNASDPTIPWFSTQRGKGVTDWGLADEPTSGYCCGSADMFTADTYASPAAAGGDPREITAAHEVTWFNAAAKLLNDSFSFARRSCGVKSALGFEVPIANTYPFSAGQEQSFYEGSIGRMAAATPVDYLWLWTPEGYTGGDLERIAADVEMARAEAHKSGAGVAVCGWTLGPAGNRTAWDSLLPADVVLASLDRNIGWDPVDPAYGDIKKHDAWVIPWLEDDPGLAGPELWVGRTLEHVEDAAGYGAEGVLGIHWRTVEVSPQLTAMSAAAWTANLTAESVYADFCDAAFGLGAACVDVLMSVDSFDVGPHGEYPSCGAPRNPWGNCTTKLPSPNMGCCGRASPGGVNMSAFDFAGTWSALRPQVVAGGDDDRVWRYDFWDAQFRYFRALGEVELAASSLSAAVAAAQKLNTTAEKRHAAVHSVIPLLGNVSRHWEVMTGWLQRSVVSPGELGTLATNEQNNWGKMTEGPLDFLADLNMTAPESALPTTVYTGPPRLWAPLPLRTAVESAEKELCISVTALRCDGPTMHWVDAGGRRGSAAMARVARSVHSACIALPGDDFEWHVVASAGGATIRFPPGLNATVSLLR
eukprot:TRINITY_DN24755_c0_g1_i1.p1 TRINITY_DN24755_c0_g1~~TRINITY_DN24755_c0_g1_i1.p1  ORF type:complete len:815 (+),score=208.57 TRINITY_DN24755_c0_g1_i1:61-2505(+)